MADVAVSRSAEKIRCIRGNTGIALRETGSIIDIVAVGIGEGVEGNAQTRILGLPREACLERIVVGVGYIPEFGELAVTNDVLVSSTVAAGAVEQSIGIAQNHGVDVFERRQSTPGAAHIIGFENRVGEKIALQTQIVLVDVWGSKVRVIEINSPGSIDGQERREINVGGRWLRRKSIGYTQTDTVSVCVVIAGILERVAQIGQRRGYGTAIGVRASRQEVRRSVVEPSRSYERRLAVELKIVLALQNVVENPAPSAQAGLAGSSRVPGKSETRRKIIPVGEVRSFGGAGVAGKDESGRRISKAVRLESRNHRKGAPLGVILGRVVFVA